MIISMILKYNNNLLIYLLYLPFLLVSLSLCLGSCISLLWVYQGNCWAIPAFVPPSLLSVWLLGSACPSRHAHIITRWQGVWQVNYVMHSNLGDLEQARKLTRLQRNKSFSILTVYSKSNWKYKCTLLKLALSWQRRQLGPMIKYRQKLSVYGPCECAVR